MKKPIIQQGYPKVFTMQSASNPDETHIVKLFGKHSYAECDCVGYRNRKRCSHIDAAQQFNDVAGPGLDLDDDMRVEYSAEVSSGG